MFKQDYDAITATGTLAIIAAMIDPSCLVKLGTFAKIPSGIPKHSLLIATGPYQLWYPATDPLQQSTMKLSILNWMNSKRNMHHLQSRHTSFIFSQALTMAALDVIQMLDELHVEKITVLGYAMKASVSWARTIITRIRMADPDAYVEFDAAIEFTPQQCLYAENIMHHSYGFVVLVRVDNEKFKSQGWDGRLNHFMIYPQCQAEVNHFSYRQAFGTVFIDRLINWDEISDSHVTPIQFKAYTTLHHLHKQYLRDYFPITTIKTIQSRINIIHQFNKITRQCFPNLRIEGRFCLNRSGCIDFDTIHGHNVQVRPTLASFKHVYEL
jgi:hypothetical protein